MARMVLLLHEVPDGTSHFDWLIDPPGALAGEDGAAPKGADKDERRLISFRVDQRLDRAGLQRFGGERLSEHRAAYLQYQGVVPGGRGRVTRVASGEAHEVRQGPGWIEVRGAFEGGDEILWRGSEQSGSWAFEAVPVRA